MALIKKASEGKLTDPVNLMADYGTFIYTAYTYDDMRRKYHSVLLLQTGDFEVQNTSDAAKDLSNWMQEINQQVEQSSSVQ